MTIHTEPLNEKIGGLPAFRVIGWPEKKLLAKVKNAIGAPIVECEKFDKFLTYTGSVGVIANGNFYLINNMSGKDETDGLSSSCVVVVNALPPEVSAHMVYMAHGATSKSPNQTTRRYHTITSRLNLMFGMSAMLVAGM